MAMKSIVLTTLSVFLGLFFIFVGSMKVTPNINRDMHREIGELVDESGSDAEARSTQKMTPQPVDLAASRRNFIQYAKVFPGSRLLGMTIDPKLYRLAVGWYEVVCGTILVLVPGRVKQASNCALLVLMLGAVYTHAALKDRFERMAPSIVFVLMLVCRLVVFYQVQSREKARAPEAARPKAD